MKKALSLILAVLMLAGCMSFSAFAGETFKISDKLAENGVAHAVLTAPVETAPVQDGVIGEGEYSVSRAGSALTVGFENSYTEYFAYDADWLYYAVEAGEEGQLGQTLKFNFKADEYVDSFDGFLNVPPMMQAKGHYYTTNGILFTWNTHFWADMGGHVFFHTGVSDLSRFEGIDPAVIYAEYVDYGFRDGGIYAIWSELADIGYNNDAQGNDSYQTVYEIKVSRKFFAESDNVYAYYFAGINWDQTANVKIGTVLDDTTKAALGTTADIAPGYIVIDEPVVYDIPAILAANGYEHTTISKPSAPTLDGNIGEYEYQASNFISKDDASVEIRGTLDYDLEEHISYDDDYIYYAIKAPIADNTYVDLRIKPAEVVDAEGVAKEIAQGTAYAWVQLKLVGGVGQEWRYRLPSAPTFLKFKDGDITFAVNKVGNDFIIELKVGRAALNEEYGLTNDDISAFAYYLSLNGTTYIGNKLNDTTAQALGFAEVGDKTAPRYMILESDDIVTSKKASVRISAEQNGLRFKTDVNNKTIAALQEKYGVENVSVGTLIAPTDTLGGAKLTHDFEGKKLDVVATLDAPFAEGELYNTYAGSITTLKDYNLDREFTAVGYIKVVDGENVEYIYSEVSACRSAAYVAEQALLDAESYTATEIELIKALIPAKVEA